MPRRQEATVFDRVLADASVLIEVRDARLPLLSAAHPLPRRFREKERIVILNKTDRADPKMTRAWSNHLRSQGETVLEANALKPGSAVSKLRSLLEKKGQAGKGRILVRAAIIGLPNVGKSTLVNSLVRRGRTLTGDRPGITKGRQWVRLSPNVYLLDSPGNFPLADKIEQKFPERAIPLALCRILPDNRIDGAEAAHWFAGWCRSRDVPLNLPDRFSSLANPDLPTMEALQAVASKMSMLSPGGTPDTAAAARRIMVDFSAGKLGRLTLEDLPSREQEETEGAHLQ